MTTAATIWLVLLLGASACLKARKPARSAAALATYGVTGIWPQRVSLGALLAVELLLAAALALGAPWAAAATAALFLLFAAATTTALAGGRSGHPCACFGSDSRLAWSSPARAAAAGALAGALALGRLPQAPSSYDRWLTVALTLSLAAMAAMGVGLLALAREVGVLRLGMAGGALEIPQEGPAVGSTQAWAGAIGVQPRALLRLAIFTSEGCPLCRQLAPAVAHVAADPMLAVRSFDEVKDPAAWSQARVPGSPYAVALSLEGVVLSKGTFNSLGQLECATKTFTAQLSLLFLVALKLAQVRETLPPSEIEFIVNALYQLPTQMTQFLDGNPPIDDIARRFYDRPFFLYLGRNIGLPVALEGALKLKEISYIPTEAYSAGEMKHGPIALLDESTPVVVVATRMERVYEKLVSNIQEVRARGAHVIAIASDDNEDIQHHADDVIYVPNARRSCPRSSP